MFESIWFAWTIHFSSTSGGRSANALACCDALPAIRT
jgi:hypothetical protein